MLALSVFALMLVANALAVYCPPGYSHYGHDTCLKYHHSNRNFVQAENTCINEGAHLARITEDGQTKFIYQKLYRGNYWLGLHQESRSRLVFRDGTPVGSYRPWAPGAEKNHRYGGACVFVYGDNSPSYQGRWDFARCDHFMPFVCQVRATRGPSHDSMRDTGISVSTRACPGGYSHYQPENTCIKFHTELQTYNNARLVCQYEGGDLVQVKDHRKSVFISGLSRHWYWMGLRDPFHNRRFTYLDGSPMGGFQPWRQGDPDNSGGRQFCVVVGGDDDKHVKGQWNDAMCSDKVSFVCERRRNCK